MESDEEKLRDDNDCRKDKWATVKDFLNTAAYLIGASGIEYLRQHLFPHGLSFVTELVFVLLTFGFVVLITRYVVGELLCLEQSILSGILEHKRFKRQIEMRDAAEATSPKVVESTATSKKRGRRKRKK